MTSRSEGYNDFCEDGDKSNLWRQVSLGKWKFYTYSKKRSDVLSAIRVIHTFRDAPMLTTQQWLCHVPSQYGSALPRAFSWSFHVSLMLPQNLVGNVSGSNLRELQTH